MRPFLYALCLLGLQSASAQADPILINFDDRPGQPPPFGEGVAVQPQFLINSQYASLGVVFNSGGGGVAVVAPSNPVSPPNVVSATAPGPVMTFAPNAFAEASFSLGGGPAVVDLVSLTLTDSSSLSRLEAFDLSGLSLGSSTGGASATLTVTFPGQIHSVRLTQGPFAFDNFTFDGLAPVPEPASITLLGVGVLGLFGYGYYRSPLTRAGVRPSSCSSL